jgi:hypothetical protein
LRVRYDDKVTDLRLKAGKTIRVNAELAAGKTPR